MDYGFSIDVQNILTMVIDVSSTASNGPFFQKKEAFLEKRLTVLRIFFDLYTIRKSKTPVRKKVEKRHQAYKFNVLVLTAES